MLMGVSAWKRGPNSQYSQQKDLGSEDVPAECLHLIGPRNPEPFYKKVHDAFPQKARAEGLNFQQLHESQTSSLCGIARRGLNKPGAS